MMTYLIFGGDMLVMAFMIGVVVWISLRDNDERIDAAARIPLEDE
jgi:cbb3-type cytochrome oxidase subunit 3